VRQRWRSRGERKKIALFTNVPNGGDLAVDADYIYRIPLILHAQGLDQIVVEQLRLDVRPPSSASGSAWWRHATPGPLVEIAMVGKYVT